MASSKRDQLLDMATELFFKHGCHTTGIDKLLAQAGVAKMTLYSHFKSKEDLILAAAERLHERSIEQMLSVLRDPTLNPAQRVYALLDYLEQAVANGEFPGCPFQNVAVQFGDPEHPIHRLSARHAHEVETYFSEGLAAAGAEAPGEVARELMLLIEGAKVLVQMTGDGSYLSEACASARRLLDSALTHQ
jgi:AcrR family transcriptional regulator